MTYSESILVAFDLGFVDGYVISDPIGKQIDLKTEFLFIRGIHMEPCT
jgi:hypothetical protein